MHILCHQKGCWKSYENTFQQHKKSINLYWRCLSLSSWIGQIFRDRKETSNQDKILLTVPKLSHETFIETWSTRFITIGCLQGKFINPNTSKPFDWIYWITITKLMWIYQPDKKIINTTRNKNSNGDYHG